MLYRIRGYPKPIKDDSQNIAATRATADKQIRAFKNLIKNNLSRCLLNKNVGVSQALTEQQILFKPGKPKANGLKGIGILGKHATLNCNVEVTDQEAKQIAEALVHLSRTISHTKCQEYLMNQRWIIPIELKLKGKSNWDSTLLFNASTETSSEDWKVRGEWYSQNLGIAFFACPLCKHVESCTCKQFKCDDLDTLP